MTEKKIIVSYRKIKVFDPEESQKKLIIDPPTVIPAKKNYSDVLKKPVYVEEKPSSPKKDKEEENENAAIKNLFELIKKKDLKGIQNIFPDKKVSLKLLNCKFVDEKGETCTPIYKACELGHSDIVQHLITRLGIDINSKITKKSLLEIAYENRHVNVITVLLSISTISKIHEVILSACRDNNLKFFRTMIEKTVFTVNNGFLSEAIKKKSTYVIEYIINHKDFDVNSICDDKNSSAFYLLIEAGYINFAIKLMKNEKFDISGQHKHGELLTMMSLYAYHPSEILYKAIIEHKNFAPEIEFLENGLVDTCINNGWIDILKSFFNDPRIRHILTDYRYISAYLLESTIYQEFVDIILDCEFMDIENICYELDDFVSQVLSNDRLYDYLHHSGIRKILKKVKNVNGFNEMSGKNILTECAKKYSLHNLVKLLMTGKFDPNSVDKHGFTALHYACNNDYFEIVDALLNHADIDIMKKVIVYDGKKSINCFDLIAQKRTILIGNTDQLKDYENKRDLITYIMTNPVFCHPNKYIVLQDYHLRMCVKNHFSMIRNAYLWHRLYAMMRIGEFKTRNIEKSFFKNFKNQIKFFLLLDKIDVAVEKCHDQKIKYGSRITFMICNFAAGLRPSDEIEPMQYYSAFQYIYINF